MRMQRKALRRFPLFLSIFLSLSLLLSTFCLDVHAGTEPANYGFESALDGWTAYATVTVSPGGDYNNGEFIWSVMPYETQMAVLEPSGAASGVFPAVADTLGLSAFSRHYLTTEFGDESAEVIYTTNFAYIYTDIALSAGESLTMSWNYIAFDYSPFNDASF